MISVLDRHLHAALHHVTALLPAILCQRIHSVGEMNVNEIRL